MREVLDSLLSWSTADFIELAVGVAAIAVLATAAFYLAKHVGLRLVQFLVEATPVRWDDVVYQRGVFNALAWLAPALVAYNSAVLLPEDVQDLSQRVLLVYMQIVLMLVLLRFIDAASEIYNSESRYARDIPVKGYVQIAKLLLVLVGGIIIFGTLLNRSPWGLLSGLGALTAVLLLVFRDTILSMVASVQLATNDLVRIGDWITFPRYDADGDVIDIALHVVKIQNFDKTITSIPTHRFIDDAFKNWRGMRSSGGRRIKRALMIDMTSIRFVDDELEARLMKVSLLKSYLRKKHEALKSHNTKHEGDVSSIDLRRLTNVGTYRAYMIEYLRAHPRIHESGMTFLVRQLPPGPDGLGIELYVFSKEQSWVAYEEIQADIMDHLLAVISEFDLRVFQHPTSHDLRTILS